LLHLRAIRNAISFSSLAKEYATVRTDSSGRGSSADADRSYTVLTLRWRAENRAPPSLQRPGPSAARSGPESRAATGSSRVRRRTDAGSYAAAVRLECHLQIQWTAGGRPRTPPATDAPATGPWA